MANILPEFVVINRVIPHIETEPIGEDRDENVAYLTKLIEVWLEPLGILNNSKAEGWREAVGNAYDVVSDNIAKAADIFPPSL